MLTQTAALSSYSVDDALFDLMAGKYTLEDWQKVPGYPGHDHVFLAWVSTPQADIEICAQAIFETAMACREVPARDGCDVIDAGERVVGLDAVNVFSVKVDPDASEYDSLSVEFAANSAGGRRESWNKALFQLLGNRRSRLVEDLTGIPL